jgi:hypothetical protein
LPVQVGLRIAEAGNVEGLEHLLEGRLVLHGVEHLGEGHQPGAVDLVGDERIEIVAPEFAGDEHVHPGALLGGDAAGGFRIDHGVELVAVHPSEPAGAQRVEHVLGARPTADLGDGKTGKLGIHDFDWRRLVRRRGSHHDEAVVDIAGLGEGLKEGRTFAD